LCNRNTTRNDDADNIESMNITNKYTNKFLEVRDLHFMNYMSYCPTNIISNFILFIVRQYRLFYFIRKYVRAVTRNTYELYLLYNCVLLLLLLLLVLISYY